MRLRIGLRGGTMATLKSAGSRDPTRGLSTPITARYGPAHGESVRRSLLLVEHSSVSDSTREPHSLRLRWQEVLEAAGRLDTGLHRHRSLGRGPHIPQRGDAKTSKHLQKQPCRNRRHSLGAARSLADDIGLRQGKSAGKADPGIRIHDFGRTPRPIAALGAGAAPLDPDS